MVLLDGKSLAAEIKEEIKKETAAIIDRGEKARTQLQSSWAKIRPAKPMWL